VTDRRSRDRRRPHSCGAAAFGNSPVRPRVHVTREYLVAFLVVLAVVVLLVGGVLINPGLT
jgi:hypothetical protein